jgi:hypothetical protein
MRRLNLLLFFVMLSSGLFAQADTAFKPRYPRSPLYCSYGFAQTCFGKVLPASGTSFNLGLNVAAFFSKKYVLGVMVEGRVFKFFGTNRKYGKIRGDVNAALIYTQPDARDSARVLFLADAFNSNPDRHFFGSNQYRYGIIFSPYPDKYGGFLLAVKRGINNYPISGAYRYFDIVKYESESYIYIDLPVDVCVEVTCKPLLSLHEKRQGKYIDFISQNLVLSAYWEHVSINRAQLNQAPITHFLKPDFFARNGTDNHFGFKVSFGFY